MNTIAHNDTMTTGWRPTPWIAAVLGLVFGGVGLLYVHRPWFAIALVVGSWGVALVLLFAIWNFDFFLDLAWLSAGSWAISIACAVYAYKVAVAGAPVAERRWYSRWYGLGAVLLATLLGVFLVRAFVFEPFRASSQSMHPTIPEGSWIFVTKSGSGTYGAFGVTIWRSEPSVALERADLIAHRLVRDPSTTYLGRIVGLPGDRIEYTNHRLVINGNPVPLRLGAREGIYQYATESFDGREATIAWMPERYSRDWAGVVPPDHYLVFGDSRDNARDSRFPEVGFIPRDHIVGRVAKIVKETDRR